VSSNGAYRIVLAEDDPDFTAAVEAVVAGDPRFEIAGVARNGAECVRLVERVDPDAVVMDIEMPEVDGVEATRAIHSDSPELPIVAISGHDYAERVIEIRTAGAADYVRKSRVEDDLCDAIAALLGI
jgi:two-component system, chemotaxis family, protein-glutamate methylesterase/glutaminase